MPEVTFTLNGKKTTASYENGESLLDVLRLSLGVTSAKNGCSQGFCGSCTVLVDERPALACQKAPHDVQGRSVTTLEGLPERARQVLASSFVAEGGVQCGFCTPGIAMRAYTLLRRGKSGDREAVARALDAHLCRCTGYRRIFDAIATAGESWQAGSLPSGTPRRPARFADGRDSSHAQRQTPGVGVSAPRYRGEDLVLGRKPFVADLRVPGMLHAAVVLSAHPRSRIVSVDTAAALARHGVVRVVTAADVPGQRLVGLVVRDWPVFVAPGEETHCVGDVIALVVAETQTAAREAARAVRVDAEVLEALTDPFAALEADAPRVGPHGNLLEACAIARGDVDAALATSAHVVSARFTTQRIEHAFLEPEACLALPTPLAAAGGKGVSVFSQGQGVHDEQAQIAAVLGIERDLVEVELVSNGGAFGGKEDLSIQAQTALAAWLLDRPVHCVLSREQSILLHPKRHPMVLDYTAGCDPEGRLTAVRARILGDSGAYASVGGKVLERAAGHSCGPYSVPAVDIEARAVYTNNPPSGAMRGFGANQAAFAIEGVLDILAERAGVDRYDIRERNLLRPGDRFATGQVMTASCGALAALQAVRDAYRSARYAGIACGIKNTGIGNGLEDTGRVILRVLQGGAVELVTGFTEMGQGLFTILRQVVVHETGLDPAAIRVVARSEAAALSGMTTASRATALGSMAARRAAQTLAADLQVHGLAELEGREYRGKYVCDFTVAPGTRVDNPITHLTFGYAAQVVILDDGGRIEKVVAAHDVGRAINPLSCVAQIEGAVHMGLGYALSEDLPCTDGRPRSLRLRDLGIMRASQVPEIEVILLEIPDEVGGYGSKGVGEIGLVPTAAAVASALAAYDGTRHTSLPMRGTAAFSRRRAERRVDPESD